MLSYPKHHSNGVECAVWVVRFKLEFGFTGEPFDELTLLRELGKEEFESFAIVAVKVDLGFLQQLVCIVKEICIIQQALLDKREVAFLCTSSTVAGQCISNLFARSVSLDRFKLVSNASVERGSINLIRYRWDWSQVSRFSWNT